MIKLKNIRRYFRNLGADVKQIRYGQNQLWASQKLSDLFSQPHFIPQTGWSMTPQAIVHILNIISINKTESIIEFGSGATTLYIAKLLQSEHIDAHFVSIESSLEWKEKMEKQLATYGLQDYVRIIHAPLTKVPEQYALENQETWYSTEVLKDALARQLTFDLVIVDGPFGGSTDFARYSAYPFLKDKTTQETIWLLDDTNRTQESEILNEWQRKSGLDRRSFERYTVLASGKQFDATPYLLR